MDLIKNAAMVKNGETALGIELGSTRIKAVLVGSDSEIIATGSFAWENQLNDGIWTYDLSEAWRGIQACYAAIAANVRTQCRVPITKIGAIGISAMMHGYLPFDAKGRQLAGFRTWRNNITGQASGILSAKFAFNIPQRWSIAHLYQALLNGEAHVKDIVFLTTLAGYVHWQLCGEKVLGIGDASGMFPVDEATGSYDARMAAAFMNLPEPAQQPWTLTGILPRVLRAGRNAGRLTEAGASLLDPSGVLEAGCLMAPPEGDAGTGMVSTNTVRKRTGNISVGTSAFSMNVLDAPLKAVYQDIDIVTTPEGAPVAMVHTNNCSSDINAWVKLFGEFAEYLGLRVTSDELYKLLFLHTVKGDSNAGGLVNYSYLSGENITRIDTGRPLFVRSPHSRFSLPNFMLSQLYAAFAPLKIGMDILTQAENIQMDVMIAQGGLFRTPIIAQQVLANMLDMPITVMETAGEGGPWGMALLALYACQANSGQSLADYLDQQAFRQTKSRTLMPEPRGVNGARQFIARYRAGLPLAASAAVIPDFETKED